MAPERYTFDDDGRIPNLALPVLVYRDVEQARSAADCEALFAGNGWLGSWRNGIFSFSPLPFDRPRGAGGSSPEPPP